jgi:hypothetical protein
MLIQLVDVAGQHPVDHFSRFITGEEPVLEKYRCVSEEFVSGIKA